MYFVWAKISVSSGRVSGSGYSKMTPGQGRTEFNLWAQAEGYTEWCGSDEHYAWAGCNGAIAVVYLGAYSDEAQASAAAGAVYLAARRAAMVQAELIG